LGGLGIKIIVIGVDIVIQEINMEKLKNLL
jgi:hypothetical protein